MRTLRFPSEAVGWLVARPAWAGPRDPECLQLGTAQGVVEVPDRATEAMVELHVTAGRLDFLDAVDALGLDAVELSRFNPAVNDDDLRHLARFRHLRSLLLESARIVGPGLQILAAHVGLEYLCLGNLPAAARDLHGVASLPRLRSLSLERCHADDDTLTSLAPTLEHVSLLNSRVGNPGVRRLAALPALQRLTLHGTAVDDAGVAALAGLPALRTLVLGETVVTADGLGALAGCSNLVELNLYGCRRVDGRAVDSLARLAGLRDLVVVGTALSHDDVSRLRAALPRCIISG